MPVRIGIGYDIHRLVQGRKLILGAVEIPYIKGLLGHSDADVLLHALCDALLGAAGEADIGEQFPDTDPRYQDISSLDLLKQVLELISAKGLKIINVDTVILAQEPKLAPFKKQIQLKLSRALGVPLGSIAVKAKTNEGLGEIGNAEAIACYAAVSLTEKGV